MCSVKYKILDCSYLDNKSVASRAGDIILKRFEVGKIRLPTGRICAQDPLTLLDDEQVLETVVAPGEYPVYLSIAHSESTGDKRVAFAMVQFSEELAAKWRMALLSGEEKSELKDGQIYGYPVYSCKGCFMDNATAEIVRGRYALDLEYYDRIVEEMKKIYVGTLSYATIEFSDGCNLIAFSSGYGCGVYASYFGLGKMGKPVCLVTDFGLANPPAREMTQVKGTIGAQHWQQLGLALPSGKERKAVKPHPAARNWREQRWKGTKYDFRMTGQEKYLKGITLVRRMYRQYPKNQNWDHDHCEFCWAEFCLKGCPDSLQEGYATLDDYHWICPTCYEDFKDLFEWEVVEPPEIERT